MKTIAIGGVVNAGKVVLVDDEDYEWASEITWHIDTQGYVVRRAGPGRKNTRWVPMHREILNPEPGLVVDHINGDKLDNRRENLRALTRRQNSTNRQNRHHTNGGRYPRGVYFDKRCTFRPWKVYAMNNWKRVYRGNYATVEEAAAVAAQLRLECGYQDAIDAQNRGVKSQP